MNRSEVLDQVKQTICNDRQDVHGNPENTLTFGIPMYATWGERNSQHRMLR